MGTAGLQLPMGCGARGPSHRTENEGDARPRARPTPHVCPEQRRSPAVSVGSVRRLLGWATPHVIDRLGMRLEEFLLEDYQVGVIQVELKLQGIVGDPPAAAEQSEDLVEHGVKVYSHLPRSPRVRICTGVLAHLSRSLLGSHDRTTLPAKIVASSTLAVHNAWQ